MAGEVIDTAFVEIRPIFTGFAAQTEAGLVANEAKLTQASTGAGLLSGKGFVAGFSKGFLGLTLASFGVAALSKGVKDVINVSGQLQKSQEGVRLEFGRSAAEVEKFAKNAAGIGISERVSEALSVRIGILAHNLGIGQAKAADMTVGLQELAGSIAEVRGVDPTTILGNLPQALAGNLRSLKQLGFAFSAAQIQQEAVREGFAKVGDSLTPTSKALGVYGLLTKQVGFFQEQAAKHSGDLVNQEHRLAAQTDNTKASLGSLLRGPLASITKGLVDGESSAIKFFQGLAQNKTVSSTFRAFGASIANVVHALGDAFKEIAPLVKVAAIVIGVTLIVALRVATGTFNLMAKAIRVTAKTFEFVAGIVVASIDKFLGGFSALADGLSHIPLVGGKFGGVADKIDAAREKLRAFGGELKALDGTSVEVSIDLRAPSGILGPPAPGAKGALNVGRNAGRVPGLRPTANLPPIIAAEEQRLQDFVSIATAKGSEAGEKRALRDLADFYAREANNVKLSLALRRGFRVSRQQALAQIRTLNEQDVADAKSAADQATQDAKDKADAAVQERQSILESQLRLDQERGASLKILVRDENRLIAFLRERVRVAKRGSAARKQAAADLQAEINNRKTIISDANAKAKENREKGLTATEDRLQDNLTLAGFTKGTADDRRALTALERFYAARVAASKKGSVARRKWKIELERVKAELRDLKKTEEGAKSDFTSQSFSFLSTQQGFAANLASNLLGNTAGLVGGSAAGTTGASPGATLPGVGGARDLPSAQGLKAEATREAGGSQPKGSQLDELIHLGRQQLSQLRLLRAGAAHPEARTSRQLAGAGTETVPQ